MTTRDQLNREANAVEAHAKDQLESWSVLGQTAKYGEYMTKANNLRRAAVLKGRERAEFMRNNGLSS